MPNLLLPAVDSALAKIRYAQPTSPTLRTLSIVLGKYAQPTTLYELYLLCWASMPNLHPPTQNRKYQYFKRNKKINRKLPPATPPTYEYENVKKIFIKDNLHKLFKQKTKKRTLVSPLFIFLSFYLFIFLCFIIQRIH